jgi:hypothetical protein
MVGESSRTAEQHASSCDVAYQHATEQQHDEETMPTTEEPIVASGGIMGFVLVDRGGTEDPAAEAPDLKKKTWRPNAFVLREGEVTSGCSTKTTQTGPSANCRGQLMT